MSHPIPTMGPMTDVRLFKHFESLSATIAQASLSNDVWASADSPEMTPSTTVVHERIRTISLHDDDYPARLRSIDFPPGLLFVIGDLAESGLAPIAIVGSRTPSNEGIADAFATAAVLARRGHSIVSGLASGIDTAAHRGALSVRGHTIAVLGTGADRVYPSRESRAARRDCQTWGHRFPVPAGAQTQQDHVPSTQCGYRGSQRSQSPDRAKRPKRHTDPGGTHPRTRQAGTPLGANPQARIVGSEVREPPVSPLRRVRERRRSCPRPVRSLTNELIALSDALASELVPMPADAPDVCPMCRSGRTSPNGLCNSCSGTSCQVAYPCPMVIPISFYTKPSRLRDRMHDF